MLAEKDVIMEKAISASWQMTEEEMIREQCRAREDWIVNNEYKDRLIAQQQDEIAQQQDEIAQQQDEIANLKGVNINLLDDNTGLQNEIRALKQLLAANGIPVPLTEK